VAVGTSIGLVDGTPVVRHVADAVDADRLARTAARLDAAAHPGVVRVVTSGPMATGFELVTAHAGQPLAAARIASVARLAGVGATVAGTLADLHERGVVHGRLVRAHVLVTHAGATVLCGLGAGERPAGPADDVTALVDLLAEALERLAGDGPVPGHELAALRSVLDRARVGAAHTPTARRLAAELGALADPGRAGGPGLRRARQPLLGALVVALAGLALAGLALVGAVARGDRPRVAVPSTSTATRSSAPAPPAGAPCVATEGHGVDATACGFAASVAGPVVVVDGARSVVGRSGDLVAVADWDCDGVPEPAFLRPGSGEVLVFGPADATGARPVVLATRVVGAADLDPLADGAGCTSLVVVDGTGTSVAIDP
jgi:hypothetical protein